MPSLDNILKELDYAIDVLHNSRLSDELETNLTNDDQKQSQRVMRVNHMGEVCAQALYRGQAMTTKDSNTRKIISKSQPTMKKQNTEFNIFLRIKSP